MSLVKLIYVPNCSIVMMMQLTLGKKVEAESDYIKNYDCED